MGDDGQAGGFRLPAPPEAARIDWPDAFGQRFTVFVDTEEEFDWRGPFRRDGHGTRHVEALPVAHGRFANLGVPLTYLVDYPIVAAPRAVEILRALLDDGQTAIGTQLHPWVNPPFDEPLSRFHSFAGNLDPAIERAKLTVLTEAIAGAFGARPIVYRAGRYGIGPQTPALLAALGYRFDTSMRAYYDYSAEAGPDFSAVPADAFRFGPDDALIALPFTTVFTGRLRSLGPQLYRALGHVPRGRGVAARLGLLSRVALTPEDMPLADALEAIRVAAGEGLGLLHFAFHSPSLAPGNTPYVRDAADLAAFWRWWDAVTALLASLGIRSAALAEIEQAACGEARTSAIAGAAGGL